MSSIIPYSRLKATLHRPYDIEVDCYGQYVDRLLFDPAGGRAHHAFIPGRVEGTKEGNDTEITIFAGAAHGVKKGTTFSVYQNPVDTEQTSIEHLEVTDRYRAVISATTTRLALPLDTPLPVVFFVVETSCLQQTLDIFLNEVDISKIKNSSWNEVDAEKAKIVLKRVGDKVEVLWSGFSKDLLPDSVTELCHNLSVPGNSPDLIKAITHAAWFSYRVDSSVEQSSSAFFDVEFKEVDEDLEPSGKNLLDSGVVDLEITEDNFRTTYCLVLSNKTEHSIWPFVFICNPTDFSIRASS